MCILQKVQRMKRRMLSNPKLPLLLLSLIIFSRAGRSQNFVPALSTFIGNTVESFAAADVNGDGKVDLIVSHSADNALTIMTNNGNGTFTFSASLITGEQPRSVIATDFNGDSKIDLVCGNYIDNTLSVFINSGIGIFTNGGVFSVGEGPISLITADVNADGRTDLICGNLYTKDLTILTNLGNATFGTSSSPSVGNFPNGQTSLAGADVNGDGKVDLVSANSSENSLTVLTNKGAGLFSLSATFPVGQWPDSVIATNINGNPAPDLISANNRDDTLTILTNDGKGTFTFSSTLEVGHIPFCVIAVDVNGDTALDLITANYGDNSLTILTNDGIGGFVICSVPSMGNASYGVNCVVAADVNSDNKPDLMDSSDSTNSLSLLLNSPTAPELKIRPATTNAVEISWSAVIPGFVLQQNSDVLATNWLEVTNSVSMTNGINWTVFSATNQNSFFRLHIIPL
jgi:hypothetical protein